MRPARTPLLLLLTVVLVACGEPNEHARWDGGLDGSIDEDGSTQDDAGADAGPDADVGPVVALFRVLEGEGVGAPEVAVSKVGGGAGPFLTDEAGWVEIELPSSGVHLLRFAGDSVLTTLIAVEASGDSLTPAAVHLLPSDTFELLEVALGTTLNGSLGLVLVHFEPAVMGGQSAALTSGGSYVHDANGSPVPGNTLLAEGGTDVLFVDVPVGMAVPSFAFPNAGESCMWTDPPAGNWVVEAGSMTKLEVRCHLVP